MEAHLKRAEADVPVLRNPIGRRPVIERRRVRRTDTQGPAMSEGDIDQLLSGALVDVLILTADDALLRDVRSAIGAQRDVTSSDDAKQALRLAAAGRYGVIVADTAVLGRDVGSFTSRIKRQAPSAVTILFGSREDGPDLMELVTTGQIFRLLLKPISPGQTRRCLDTAIERHRELKAEQGGLGAGIGALERASGRRPGFGVLTGIAAVAAAGLLWWLTGGESGDVATPPAVVQGGAAAALLSGDAPDAEAAAGAQAADLERRLNDAVFALASGALVEPAGGSATDHASIALALAPDSQAAQQTMQQVLDAVLERAAIDLGQGRLDDADRGLQRIASLATDRPRLSALQAELSSARQTAAERELDLALAARGAAAPPVTRAAAPPATTPAAPTAIEPAATRSAPAPQAGASTDAAAAAPRPKPAATAAAAAPGNRPGAGVPSPATETGPPASAANESAAAAPARTAQRAPRPAVAETAEQKIALAEPPPAAAVDPIDELLAGLLNSLEEDQLVEPAGENAVEYLRRIKAIAPEHAGWVQGARAFAGRVVGHAQESLARGDYDAAEQWLAQATSLGIDTPSLSETRGSIQQARIEAESLRIVPATQLELLDYTPPAYPSLAVRRNVEGWVDVEFTVTRDGRTRDVQIVATERPGYFEDATLTAVGQWRFKPREFRGQLIDQRVSARVTFEYK